ncbi:MAG: hypothetical protein ACLFQJ_00475 [Campylobacterales bacterium]
MESAYPFILTIHLFCATVFIGALFFWTFIISRAFRSKSREDIGEECIEKSETLISKHTRPILLVVVTLLLLSGFAMFHPYAKALFEFDSAFALMFGVKIVLALIVGLLFYMMPYIHRSLKKRGTAEIVHDKLHLFMFVSVVFIVVLAKFMFYL